MLASIFGTVKCARIFVYSLKLFILSFWITSCLITFPFIRQYVTYMTCICDGISITCLASVLPSY